MPSDPMGPELALVFILVGVVLTLAVQQWRREWRATPATTVAEPAPEEAGKSTLTQEPSATIAPETNATTADSNTTTTTMTTRRNDVPDSLGR